MHQTGSRLENYDFTAMKGEELKLRIEEMYGIKMPVCNELRDLESKRQKLQAEVGSLTLQIDELKQELLHQQMDLHRLKMSVVQVAQVAQREAVERNTPELGPPKRMLSNSIPRILRPNSNSQSCRIYNCFDHLLVPPILGPPGGDIWMKGSQMLPARRKFLLLFQGETRALKSLVTTHQGMDDAELDIERVNLNENNLDNFIIQHLKDMSNGVTLDTFFIQFECIPASDERKINEILDWSLCGTDSSRKAILRESTFALILAPSNINFTSTASMQARFYEALKSGAIPIVLGGDRVSLSYEEVMAWRRAVILLPKVRILNVLIFRGDIGA